MQKLEQLYEGKAKKVFRTDDPELYIVDYKDDATAFNGLKKGTIAGKGVINNQMTNHLMRRIEKAGIPTHFVQELSERGDPGEEGLHRAAGGYHPQPLCRVLRQAVRCGGGHRIRRSHHRVLLQERRTGRSPAEQLSRPWR